MGIASEMATDRYIWLPPLPPDTTIRCWAVSGKDVSPRAWRTRDDRSRSEPRYLTVTCSAGISTSGLFCRAHLHIIPSHLYELESSRYVHLALYVMLAQFYAPADLLTPLCVDHQNGYTSKPSIRKRRERAHLQLRWALLRSCLWVCEW